MKPRLSLLGGMTLIMVLGLLVHHVLHAPDLARSKALRPITLEEVAELTELVTLKVPQQQVVETELVGYSGATRCILIARGEALISTDLAAAELAFDGAQRTVTVTLPSPRVLTCTLDHSATGVVLVTRSGLWAYVPGEAGETHVVEAALAEARQQMHAAAGDRQRIDQARQRTCAVLREWFAKRGWELQIQWRPP